MFSAFFVYNFKNTLILSQNRHKYKNIILILINEKVFIYTSAIQHIDKCKYKTLR